jgi:hypothetical protein
MILKSWISGVRIFPRSIWNFRRSLQRVWDIYIYILVNRKNISNCVIYKRKRKKYTRGHEKKKAFSISFPMRNRALWECTCYFEIIVFINLFQFKNKNFNFTFIPQKDTYICMTTGIHGRVKISHLVHGASLPTSRQQVVFAISMMSTSCQ